ncbi:MAG: hypothetical protein E6I87_07795 [Chloroflexi bacterium]|nr:MAG: hypothetical protein E6I87_07795 [Chloroflexota bacterium]
MRVLAVIAAAAIAASLAVATQSTANAAPPVAVSIQIMPTTFFPVELGTWSASGAISDSGTYVRTEVDATGSIPSCPCAPEHTGAFKEVFVLTGSQGTLTVKEEALLRTSGVTGVWQITSGTGAYERASGHGTDVFFGPPLTLELSGVISKAE